MMTLSQNTHGHLLR